jgi:2'-hydroxyisoflavone reductase
VKHLLILGGTRFLGRHIAQAAIEAGHHVTLLNRGRTNPHLFAHAEHLHGDRDGDLSALADRRFDAVIDCCGYTAAQMHNTLQVLSASGAAHYVFVSSISVHATFAPGQPYDEDAPLLTGDSSYGEQKAACEKVLAAAWRGGYTVVRPGLIVGPFDPTGRFTYWPARIQRGGHVLVPGRPERPVQWIDARDLAAWCVALAVARTAGTFNAVGPLVPMQALTHTCIQLTQSHAQLHWLHDAAVQAANIAPWTGLPLWLPEADLQVGGMLLGRNERAVAAGLHCRPTTDTVRDTLAWLQSDASAVAAPSDALTPEREAAVLAQSNPPTQ